MSARQSQIEDVEAMLKVSRRDCMWTTHGIKACMDAMQIRESIGRGTDPDIVPTFFVNDDSLLHRRNIQPSTITRRGRNPGTWITPEGVPRQVDIQQSSQASLMRAYSGVPDNIIHVAFVRHGIAELAWSPPEAAHSDHYICIVVDMKHKLVEVWDSLLPDDKIFQQDVVDFTPEVVRTNLGDSIMRTRDIVKLDSILLSATKDDGVSLGNDMRKWPIVIKGKRFCPQQGSTVQCGTYALTAALTLGRVSTWNNKYPLTRASERGLLRLKDDTLMVSVMRPFLLEWTLFFLKNEEALSTRQPDVVKQFVALDPLQRAAAMPSLFNKGSMTRQTPRVSTGGLQPKTTIPAGVAPDKVVTAKPGAVKPTAALAAAKPAAAVAAKPGAGKAQATVVQQQPTQVGAASYTKPAQAAITPSSVRPTQAAGTQQSSQTSATSNPQSATMQPPISRTKTRETYVLSTGGMPPQAVPAVANISTAAGDVKPPTSV